MMPIPWDYLQENLVTLADIARKYQLTRTAPHTWSKFPDWPDPVLVISSHSSAGVSLLWWWPDVQAFCDRHQVIPVRGMPRPGRPRRRAQSPAKARSHSAGPGNA